MVSPLDPTKAQGDGLFIIAADVSNAADDCGQLLPMMEQAEEMTGQCAKVTLAHGGYHTGANLEACEQRGQRVAMPEGQREAMKRPYFKDRFEYEVATDSYLCPQGHRLIFRGLRRHNGRKDIRLYRATGAICRACPAFEICTRDRRWGRTLWIGPHDALLRRHRHWIDTDEAQALYARRKELSEPTFGILKEQMGAQRFLLRGLTNVKAEFVLLATAFNLRTLWRVWTSRRPLAPTHRSAAAAVTTL